MDRSGRAGEHSIRLRKTVSISAGQSSLSVRYEIEQIPAEACLHFAVEINLAAMAVDGSAGHYADPSGTIWVRSIPRSIWRPPRHIAHEPFRRAFD